MVQTLDFITPVVNDPYAFGAIAAANAISDIYAMGAKPVFALNIIGFPVKTLPLSILEEILKGGADKATEAGVSIAGGHSVDESAPKYGLSVTGMIEPARIVHRKGAQDSDVLFLTKPLGIGILTTAIDRGLVGGDMENHLYSIMAHLNKGASEAMQETGVHACTDVTGFGLLGHLYEMLSGSDITAQLFLKEIPMIQHAKEFAEKGTIPAGAHNNYRYVREFVAWSDGINEAEKMLLCDPQTSGGLLIAVSGDKADELKKRLQKSGCLVAAEIGIVKKKENKESSAIEVCTGSK